MSIGKMIFIILFLTDWLDGHDSFLYNYLRGIFHMTPKKRLGKRCRR